MIKANELRIGNLVKDRGGKIIRIDFFENESRPNIIKFGQRVYLGETEVHGLTEYSDFAEPIPITEELLTKVGAIKIRENSYNLHGMQINFVNGKWIEYVHRIELTGIHHLHNVFYFTSGKELIFEGLNQ